MANVQFNTTITQTLLPIILNINDVGEAPTIFVSPVSDPSQSGFTVPAKIQGDGTYEAQFWLERPGDYKVSVTSQNFSETHTLHIQAHKFLSFGSEFGLFLGILLVAFGGLVLWYKKRTR